ncbi:protein of unknown function [Pararobbsia alpina]
MHTPGAAMEERFTQRFFKFTHNSRHDLW